MNEESAKLMVHWITEREKIREKKEAREPPPWTKDHILQTYRFCNVQREDDKVTRWIAKNVRPLYNILPIDDYTKFMVICRMFNRPEHLVHLVKHVSWDRRTHLPKLSTISYNKRAQGIRMFNPAYIVSTAGVRMDKVEYVYYTASTIPSIIFALTLQDAFDQLSSTKGLGSFLTGQILADLKNTHGHPLSNASDWFTWAAPGPGSRRGLSRLVNGPGDSRAFPLRQFLGTLQTCHKAIEERIELKLCAQDFQNCLCEFDKYVRVLRGEGRPKQNYTPFRN